MTRTSRPWHDLEPLLFLGTGTPPNPSIERRASISLRLLESDAHVKRQALDHAA
jgi:hypothetical protein